MRSFRPCTIYQILSGWSNEDEIGEKCSTHGRDEKCTYNSVQT